VKRLLLLSLLVLAEVAASQSATGIVTGRILTKDGAPAAAIRVSAVPLPDVSALGGGVSVLASVAETDRSGQYRLENIPPGRYFITAGPIDSPTYYPGATSAAAATAVTVAASVTARNIDFTITFPVRVTVRGRVIAPAGIPLRNQRVALDGMAGGFQPDDAPVNTDGTFQFLKVRPGNYLIRVLPTDVFSISQPKTITVTDQDTDGIELTLKANVIVDWNAVVDGGGLFPRLTMSLVPFDGGDQPPSSITLWGTGYLRHLVTEGNYRVTWTGLPAGYHVKSVTSGSTDVLTNPLKVAATDVLSVLVTLGVSSPPPWVKVRGRVTGGTSKVPSLASLRVVLTGNTTARPLPAANVNADGSFEFPMVLPGNYVASLHRGEERDIRRPAVPMLPVPVLVPSQDVTTLQIAIPAVKTITARVTVNGTGKGPRELTFRFADTLGDAEITVAAELQPDGTFKVEAPVGVRRIGLQQPFGSNVRELKYKSVDLLADAVTIDASDNAELLVTVTPFIIGVEPQ
jgi:hypothetical protein